MKLSTISESETTLDLSTLYHATRAKDLPSIMKTGLDPSRSEYADDEEANDCEDYGPPYHFVYLGHNLKVAQWWAKQCDQKDEWVFLEVKLPPKLQSKLITDRGEFIRCPFVINPKYIKQVA